MIVNVREEGLWLRVSGEVETDIMVFGQEPCSAGRSRRGNVAYLGLLPPAVGGRSEITNLYKARYGEPRVGTKVFIVTCQQQDGWKGEDWVSSEVVPEVPAKHGYVVCQREGCERFLFLGRVNLRLGG